MGIGDQAVWNGTNLLFNLVAIRTLDLPTFGWFSAMFIVVLVASGTINSFYTESAIAVHGEEVANSSRSLFHTVARVGLVGVVGSALIAPVAVAMQVPLPAVALVLILSPVVMQDCLRQHLIAARRAHLPLAGETSWLLLQLGAALFLDGFWLRAFWPYTLGTLISASICVVGVLRTAPGVGDGRGARAQQKMRRDLAFEHLLTAGVSQLTVLFIGWGGDVSQVGLARAVFIAFGPLNTLIAGAKIVLLPDARQAARGSMAKLARVTDQSIAVVAVAVVVWSALIVAVQPLTELLFGASADQVRGLLAFAGFARVGPMAIQAPLVALRAMGRTDVSRRARMFTSAVLVTVGAGAGALFAVEGFLLALGAAGLLALWYWRSALRSALSAA